MVYPGQHVQVYVDDASVEEVCVVFEDAQYLLVNKRQGIETQGAENSAEAMCARHAGVPVFACHRLDAQTGGLLRTGPTGTNVNDLSALLIGKPRLTF